MSKPQRIQLSRKKGFNLQKVSLALNGLPAVVVSKPTMFGNPFWKGYGCRLTAAAHYKLHLLVEMTLIKYKVETQNHHMRRVAENLHNLRGKNLACWCPTDIPDCCCHAGILLEYANKLK